MRPANDGAIIARVVNVLVTGASGFLGQRLVESLLADGSVVTSGGEEVAIETLRACDVVAPPTAFADDERLEMVIGDFTAPGAIGDLVDDRTAAVFHLAAVVSGEAQRDFELGMRVNFDASRHLLEACRHRASRPRLVFASSVAVYGGALPEVVDESVPLDPQSSYGAQKSMTELLVAEYTRRDFIDGRSLRLPTIVVRSGKPNAAASTFASSILRDPLQGRETVCPVSEEAGVWLLSPRRVTEAFCHAARLSHDDWGGRRAVCLPGMTVTVREMLAALGEVAGAAAVDRVRFAPDPFIESLVAGWPVRFSTEAAEKLGFRRDDSMRSVIEAFIEDHPEGIVIP